MSFDMLSKTSSKEQIERNIKLIVVGRFHTLKRFIG